MELCKYLNTNGIDLLRECRIKLTSFPDCNDPFDFYLPISEPTTEEVSYLQNNIEIQNSFFKATIENGLFLESQRAEFIQAFQKSKELIERLMPDILRKKQEAARKNSSKFFKVICLSDLDLINEEEDVLLWSHYTDKHKGIRIVIDFSDKYKSFTEVDYFKELEATVTEVLLSPDLLTQKLKQALSKKSSVWQYEHEKRIIIPGEDTINEYAQLEPQSIKFVDLGLYCEKETTDEVKYILNQKKYSHIELRKVEMNGMKRGFLYKGINKS